MDNKVATTTRPTMSISNSPSSANERNNDKHPKPVGQSPKKSPVQMSSSFHQQLGLVLNGYYPASGNDVPNDEVPQPAEWMHSRFNGLHQQRSYLLNSLQHENLKATDLLRKITKLEGDLRKGTLNFPKRKTKKQLGWLKSRHQETCLQERTILAQLGQVSYDIQRRERVAQVTNELQYLQAQGRIDTASVAHVTNGLLYFDAQGGSNSASYDPTIATMQQVYLNPASPVFEPENSVPSRIQSTLPEWQRQHGDYTWGDITHDQPTENYYNEEISQIDDPPVEEARSPITRKLIRPVISRRTVSMNDADLEPCCSEHSHLSKWTL